MSQFPSKGDLLPNAPDPFATAGGPDDIASLVGAAASVTRVRTMTVVLDEFPLDVPHHRIVSAAGFARATIQATNRNGVTWSTAVIKVGRSVTGNPADVLDFGSAVTISAAGITLIEDITTATYLHIYVGTAESASGEIQLTIQLDDIDSTASA